MNEEWTGKCLRHLWHRDIPTTIFRWNHLSVYNVNDLSSNKMNDLSPYQWNHQLKLFLCQPKLRLHFINNCLWHSIRGWLCWFGKISFSKKRLSTLDKEIQPKKGWVTSLLIEQYAGAQANQKDLYKNRITWEILPYLN